MTLWLFSRGNTKNNHVPHPTPLINKQLSRDLPYGLNGKHTVDTNRRLRGEQERFVRLAKIVGQDALQESRPVPQDGEHEVLTLATQPVHPAENLGQNQH